MDNNSRWMEQFLKIFGRFSSSIGHIDFLFSCINVHRLSVDFFFLYQNSQVKNYRNIYNEYHMRQHQTEYRQYLK